MSIIFLAHHGIEGQKWGVRRYQNEDGTRTAQGKQHRRDIEGAKYEREHIISNERRTNPEERKNLEQKFRRLRRETTTIGKAETAGRLAAVYLLSDVIKSTVSTVTANMDVDMKKINKVIDEVITKKLKEKIKD